MKYLGFGKPPIILGLLIGFPVSAHHSPTYFDSESEIVHENVTVITYRIANPHGILVYVIADDEGNEEEWNAELPSANFLRRGGLDDTTLGPGDKLTVVIGSPGVAGSTRRNLIRLTRAEFPNGDVATFTGISAAFIQAETE
jgi:hypothetical protein